MGLQHTFNSPLLFPTLTFPCISPYLPHTPSHFPTPPLIPLPTSPPTPQHIFLLSLHHPSLSQSVAKLPCDEVSVAKLLWRSYWQPSLPPVCILVVELGDLLDYGRFSLCVKTRECEIKYRYHTISLLTKSCTV